MGEEELIICHTLSESPHSARGPVGKLLSTFYSLNWKDLHTRGGRGGKRGYSLRLFAYTGRFRLGSLMFNFLFWEILNTDRDKRFPNIGCICQLSPFPHRSRQPGWVFPKEFPPTSLTFPTGLRFPQTCVTAEFALRGLCLVWTSWLKKVEARLRCKGKASEEL